MATWRRREGTRGLRLLTRYVRVCALARTAMKQAKRLWGVARLTDAMMALKLRRRWRQRSRADMVLARRAFGVGPGRDGLARFCARTRGLAMARRARKKGAKAFARKRGKRALRLLAERATEAMVERAKAHAAQSARAELRWAAVPIPERLVVS
jgi:hypothetical protein